MRWGGILWCEGGVLWCDGEGMLEFYGAHPKDLWSRMYAYKESKKEAAENARRAERQDARYPNMPTPYLLGMCLTSQLDHLCRREERTERTDAIRQKYGICAVSLARTRGLQLTVHVSSL